MDNQTAQPNLRDSESEENILNINLDEQATMRFLTADDYFSEESSFERVQVNSFCDPEALSDSDAGEDLLMDILNIVEYFNEGNTVQKSELNRCCNPENSNFLNAPEEELMPNVLLDMKQSSEQSVIQTIYLNRYTESSLLGASNYEEPTNEEMGYFVFQQYTNVYSATNSLYMLYSEIYRNFPRLQEEFLRSSNQDPHELSAQTELNYRSPEMLAFHDTLMNLYDDLVNIRELLLQLRQFLESFRAEPPAKRRRLM